MNNGNNEKQYYTVKDLMDMFELSRKGIISLIDKGELKADKFSSKYVVSKKNLDEYLFNSYAKSKGMNPKKVRDFIDYELIKHKDILEALDKIDEE